jgi:hypothetical protein
MIRLCLRWFVINFPHRQWILFGECKGNIHIYILLYKLYILLYIYTYIHIFSLGEPFQLIQEYQKIKGETPWRMHWVLTLREILCYRYVFFLERPDIQFFLSKTGHDTITNITHTHITRFLRRAEFRAEFRLCSSDMGIPKTMAFSFLSHGLMTRMMAGGTPILGNSYIYIYIKYI